MAITNTFVDEFVWNKLYIRIYDITLDSSYPTNGYTAALGFSPIKYRLKKILGLVQIGCDAAADLIVGVKFDITNNKLLAYRTAQGTLSGNVIVKGGGIGEAIGINPDSNAGVLSKAAATDRTIPIATFLGATDIIAQGSFAEVANGVSLANTKLRCMIFGR